MFSPSFPDISICGYSNWGPVHPALSDRVDLFGYGILVIGSWAHWCPWNWSSHSITASPLTDGLFSHGATRFPFINYLLKKNFFFFHIVLHLLNISFHSTSFFSPHPIATVYASSVDRSVCVKCILWFHNPERYFSLFCFPSPRQQNPTFLYSLIWSCFLMCTLTYLRMLWHTFQFQEKAWNVLE